MNIKLFPWKLQTVWKNNLLIYYKVQTLSIKYNINILYLPTINLSCCNDFWGEFKKDELIIHYFHTEIPTWNNIETFILGDKIDSKCCGIVEWTKSEWIILQTFLLGHNFRTHDFTICQILAIILYLKALQLCMESENRYRIPNLSVIIHKCREVWEHPPSQDTEHWTVGKKQRSTWWYQTRKHSNIISVYWVKTYFTHHSCDISTCN